MSRLQRARIAAVALAIAAFAFAPPSTSGQALYGSIVGTVTDAQGGVTPGVTLVAVNTGTGLKVETQTDETGSYAFRNLLPGTYDLSATLTGFKEFKQTSIPVTAGNPVRVNVTLVVGALEEVVDVVSQSTILQTEKADISAELSSKAIVNLPLNQYRNYQALMNLVPGATPAQFQNAEIDTPARALRTWVNGTQPNSNATRIDGAVSVNIWLPHHIGYVQPAETIDTVAISTNNFDADLGMAGGAASTVITKSGTNTLHGSAFWFLNRDTLNANSLFNNANDLDKPPLTRDTFGGTAGGPIVRNKFFYFGSWERFQDRRPGNYTYTVPTAKMREGDFTEVAEKYSSFRLFNPFTGTGGTGREQWSDFKVPSNLISSVARAINKYYPASNTTTDINRNSIIGDDYVQRREVTHDRDNFDFKFTYQRSAAHSIWGKFSVMDAEVVDNFILGFDKGSLGDTRTYVYSAGHTWTLSPTMVLDGNFGANIMNQTVTGPDYGQNLGQELGIPGVNGTSIRESGLPTFANGFTIGSTPNWMPLFRKERTYTFSSALTKVLPKHELRLGLDVVNLQLNHWQAEWGDYGLKGGFSFSGNTTGGSGYIVPSGGWNSYAAFLLGIPSYFAKDTQYEEMTGREWQTAIYLRDRWNISPKLTASAGVRMEYYPLMHRKDRGLEILDYNTYEVSIGGRGGVPDDVGIDMKKLYFAPRLGAMYRIDDKSVFRVGYGQTVNPLPWSRPLRGSFPLDINFNQSAEQYLWTTTLNAGIPAAPVPDISSGHLKLPQGVFMRSPNPNDVNRAIIQQWNIAYERRLPGNISAEFAYVGTKTDGGYADLNLNYGEPGGGNASRHYFAVAGTTAINDWASRTKARYHGLQIALNRPFQNGLLLKGAYTFSRAKDMADEDGWTGLTWNHPLMYDENFALGGFDRTHVFQLGYVYELPFLRGDKSAVGAVLGGWQINGIFAAYSGTPYSIGGTNNPLNCPGCGSVFINISRDPEPVGTVGSPDQAYYPVEIFSQPTGIGKEGFGNSSRNRFRRPPVWYTDFSMIKAFNVGRFRPELRIESSNVLNHPNWGAPETSITSLNFMKFTPGNAESGTNTPGSRTVRIALRFQF